MTVKVTQQTKFCQNLQLATFTINTIWLTIRREVTEIKQSTPGGEGWLKTEISDFVSHPGAYGGGGGLLKTFHRLHMMKF